MRAAAAIQSWDIKSTNLLYLTHLHDVSRQFDLQNGMLHKVDPRLRELAVSRRDSRNLGPTLCSPSLFGPIFHYNTDLE